MAYRLDESNVTPTSRAPGKLVVCERTKVAIFGRDESQLD
jgi:hypothetical protein